MPKTQMQRENRRGGEKRSHILTGMVNWHFLSS